MAIKNVLLIFTIKSMIKKVSQSAVYLDAPVFTDSTNHHLLQTDLILLTWFLFSFSFLVHLLKGDKVPFEHTGRLKYATLLKHPLTKTENENCL